MYANDLNPQCAHYLRINAAGSKVKHLVKCYNVDARDFIRALLKPGPGPGPEEFEELAPAPAAGAAAAGVAAGAAAAAAAGTAAVGTAAAGMAGTTAAGTAAAGTAGTGAGAAEGKTGKAGKEGGEVKQRKPPKPQVKWAVKTTTEDEGAPPAGAVFDHITMNLPATAIEFLDVFKGAFDREVWGDRKLPTIHCYTFKKASESFDDVVARGEGHLGAIITDPHVHEVRDVAPNKIMLCLSFTLTPEVAFGVTGDADHASSKRARTAE